MKKIIALLIALTMISSFLPTIAMAEEEIPGEFEVHQEQLGEYKRNYDFETPETSGSFEVIETEDYGKIARHPASEMSLSGVAPKGTDTTIFETDIAILTDDEGNSIIDGKGLLLFYHGDAIKCAFGRYKSTGNFRLLDKDSGIPFEVGRWYHVRVEIRLKPGNLTLIVTDDNDIKHTYSCPSTFTSFERSKLQPVESTAYDTEKVCVFYDNFKLYYMANLYTATATAHNYEGNETSFDAVDYIAPSFKITFSEAMKYKEETVGEGEEAVVITDLDADVKIYDEEGEEVPFTGSLDETKTIYTIVPDVALTAKGNYRLVVSGALSSSGMICWNGEEKVESFEIPFTVSKKDLSIENVVEAFGAYSVTIRNKTFENQDAYIVIARYDGEKCVSVNTCPVTGDVDGVEYIITTENLGTEDAVILMAADGSFLTLDIWDR